MFPLEEEKMSSSFVVGWFQIDFDGKVGKKSEWFLILI